MTDVMGTARPAPGTPGPCAEALGYVEWHHFAGEYPRFEGRGEEFAGRLRAALASTFAGEPG
ncbi:hypothetical protein [Streptomyces pakalii]|uniref:Uncharacterized protein n=1 Tax=Streptomyces pakalii TaxID=3036494 RepID=A0ABT7DC48_9ACTN|nr:hypothetical protein [Streptomyces pakalii]MDJ1643392.1 hypothetical protein [Streptomyces pakalii]